MDYLEEVDDEYWTSNALGVQPSGLLSRINPFNIMVNLAEVLEDIMEGKVRFDLLAINS